MRETGTLAEMQHREVVNVKDGKCLGSICDVEINWKTGRVESIIVPGPCRFFGLFGREPDYIIAWHEIQKIGEDIILVCFDPWEPEKKTQKKPKMP
jgi:YlmC/YmxH family sporulation protein